MANIKIIILSLIIFTLISKAYKKNKTFTFYLCYFLLTVLIVLACIFFRQIADNATMPAEFISKISVFSKMLSVVSICMVGGGLNAVAEYIVNSSKNKRLSR